MTTTTTITRSTAPASTMSRADQAAHAAASWLSPAGREALRRADTAAAKILDDRYTAALNQRGLAEYEQYAQGVPA